MTRGTQLILVTGFLGAGKTTALKGLLRLWAGARVHVIVNEFGAVGYDGAEMAGLASALTEIDGGSIFCACRLGQFEQALNGALADAPELILVESSGLSDPTAIRSIVERPGAFEGLVYRGCIALVDATRLYKVLNTARACARQLSVSDLILLNKTDMATEEQLAWTRTLLHEHYPVIPVYETVRGAVAPAWLDALSPTHQAMAPDTRRDLTLQRRLLQIAPRTSARDLSDFLRFFAEDTCRIKGVVEIEDGFFQVQCVGVHVVVSRLARAAAARGLVVLAGEGQPLRARLREALKLYPNIVEEMS